MVVSNNQKCCQTEKQDEENNEFQICLVLQRHARTPFPDATAIHNGIAVSGRLLALLRVGFVKSCPQPFGKFNRIIIGPEMHEKQPWLFFEHVAVYSRYRDAIFL